MGHLGAPRQKSRMFIYHVRILECCDFDSTEKFAVFNYLDD